MDMTWRGEAGPRLAPGRLDACLAWCAGGFADEFVVGFEVFEGFEELVDLLVGLHVVKSSSEGGGGFEGGGVEQEVFLAGAGVGEVDRGEDATVGHVAIEDQFHIAGAFELFKDDLVAAGAGVDEAGGDDGE